MIKLISKEWEIDQIDTILFDKDGTLTDLHYFWGKITEMRALKIINYFGLSQNNFEKICSFLGYDINSKKMLSDGITALYSRSKIIEIFKNNLLELNVDATTNILENIFDEVSEEFYKDITQYTKPINDAVNFFKKAYNKGIKLGIVTSDSIVSTKLVLKNFGWEKYFSSVIARESSNKTKESGELTKLALKELNADNSRTIMIGDAPMDYISAKNANLKETILISSGQIDSYELKKITKYVLSSLSEIEIK